MTSAAQDFPGAATAAIDSLQARMLAKHILPQITGELSGLFVAMYAARRRDGGTEPGNNYSRRNRPHRR